MKKANSDLNPVVALSGWRVWIEFYFLKQSCVGFVVVFLSLKSVEEQPAVLHLVLALSIWNLLEQNQSKFPAYCKHSCSPGEHADITLALGGTM